MEVPLPLPARARGARRVGSWSGVYWWRCFELAHCERPAPGVAGGLAVGGNLAVAVFDGANRGSSRVSGFGSGAYSAKLLAGTKQRFSGLPFRRRGRNSIERWPEERALGPAWSSDRSLLGQAHAAGKILADPMGHERTGEAHH